MIGCRKLTDEEITKLMTAMTLCDSAIFMLGLRTGFRISELLSLNIQDVFNDDGSIRNAIKVHKRNTKGKIEGRSMPVHREAKIALAAYLDTRDDKNPLAPAFTSRLGRLNRRTYDVRLKEAAYVARIDRSRLSTHSMRKTFAHKVHAALGNDILKTQRALGHKSLSNTAKYLSIDEEEVSAAILAP